MAVVDAWVQIGSRLPAQDYVILVFRQFVPFIIIYLRQLAMGLMPDLSGFQIVRLQTRTLSPRR
jgi:hypothetical protein